MTVPHPTPTGPSSSGSLLASEHRVFPEPFTSCLPASLWPAPLSSALLFLCSPNTITHWLFHFPFLSLGLPLLDFPVQPLVNRFPPLVSAMGDLSYFPSLSLPLSLTQSPFPGFSSCRSPFTVKCSAPSLPVGRRALPPISYTGSLECWSRPPDSW